MFFIAALVAIAAITAIISRSIDDFPILEYLGCNNCLRVYVPVCGTDNVTYVNPCRLNCANSKKKKKDWVYIVRYGPCARMAQVYHSNYSVW